LGAAHDLREVLLVINNYTGDRLNFGLALTRARALYPRISIDAIVVADDVSLLKSPTPSLVGARGLGGNILVCKLVGAYAETGASLAQVKRFGDAVVGSLASIGVGLEHCHVPGRKVEGSASDEGDYDCEVGMGLHNEPGVRKGNFENAEQLVGEMLGMILNSRGDGNGEEAFLRIGKSVDDSVLFLNNLGGMSQLEMGAILDETLLQLKAISIHPRRIYSSAYMTSLNAPGFSLSLLNLSHLRRSLSQDGDIDVLALLDAPTEATAWAGVRTSWPDGIREFEHEQAETESMLRSLHQTQSVEPSSKGGGGDAKNYWQEADISVNAVEAGIRAACVRVLEIEADLTAYDTVVGDGDCGETFAAGAKAVLKALDSGDLDIKSLSPSDLMRRLGEILEASMGGTIGALLAIFFTSMATAVPSKASDSWHEAPAHALAALSTHTPARPGDRTIVDALSPFCSSLADQSPAKSNWTGCTRRCGRQGRARRATKGMKARLGRAVYVGGDEGLPPDPGACGVAAVLDGLWAGMGSA
ncbi:hypothetical protein EWM64_g7241, partial [Hericium alpestre]